MEDQVLELGYLDEEGEEEEEEEEDEEGVQGYDTFSDEEDDIEDLFNKNTESFRCLAQILMSRSSLLRHILYHYPPLEDPGINDAFNYVEPEPVADDIGVEKYKNLCKDFDIIPLRRVIESLPNRVMDLKFYGLTMLEVKTICTTLMLNSHVQVLILEDNWMTPDAIYYLGEALRENNSIKVLNMKECRIGPEGAHNLVEGLSLNQSLRELDLSYNDLGDEGVLRILGALQENQQVQKLNLSHNHLTDACGKAFGAYLRENASTDYLDLSWNNFNTIPGLKDLCNGLIANKSVSYLNLAWNGIATMEAIGPIVRLLKLSTTLEHLDLSSNRMMTPLLEAIRQGLLKSNSLVSIKLGGNLITPSDAEFLVTPLLKDGKPLTYIDLENVFVEKSFVPIWKRIKYKGKSVRIEGILDNYVIKGPNKIKVIFERCKYLAQKPKKKKQKRDFGTFIYTLPDEILDKKDLKRLIKKYKMKLLDNDLIGALCELFKAQKNKVNIPLLKERFLKMYPDTTPPPPPKPKKKGKGKKKGVGKEENAVTAAIPVAPEKSLIGTVREREKSIGGKDESQFFKQTVEEPTIIEETTTFAPDDTIEIPQEETFPDGQEEANDILPEETTEMLHQETLEGAGQHEQISTANVQGNISAIEIQPSQVPSGDEIKNTQTQTTDAIYDMNPGRRSTLSKQVSQVPSQFAGFNKTNK